ncbi:uncharacterized protein LOC116169656 [Photinus pyralis]|uniref:uncharacterized protein LOC116165568 n=1 Tax=Photinus pyralis TaxID=7054 RepID=UPI00126704C5|nr:uncharacterized protein LOC116165568 [Photinus pyralis]XP_031341663.1 uncharacterized protein LOC116169656 [Photinus pyralis]
MTSKNTFRSSRVSCCVVGCSNSYINTDSSVKFYSFPNRPYELQRRENWIKEVKRVTENGKPWTPKKTDRICSSHFVGNAKSNIATNPSYNPSIFPKTYKQTRNLGADASKRFERYGTFKKRKLNVSSDLPSSSTEFQEAEVVSQGTDDNPKDVSCQVNFQEPTDTSFVFVCEIENNCVGVQANIVPLSQIVNTADKCVGNDDMS